MKRSIIFAEDCPDVRKHTKQPSGYVDWHAWCDKKEQTHIRKQCPTCGLWVMWVKQESRTAYPKEKENGNP